MKKFIVYSLGSILMLITGIFIGGAILQFNGVDVTSLTKSQIMKQPILMILPNLMWMVFILLIYKNYMMVKKGFNEFRKSPLKNLKIMGLALAVMFVISFGIRLFGYEDSVNQKTVAESTLVSLLIVPVLLAPFTEELIFRQYLIGESKNKKLMTIVSSFLFMLPHVASEIFNGSVTLFEFTLLATPYLLLGGVFGYTYYRYRNIALNITLHASWNLLAVILILLQ